MFSGQKNVELPDARPIVDRLLTDALRRGASDIHLEPTAQGYEARFRIDGLLELDARFEISIGRAMVSRLMVMAQLLTYRLDVPQEGRFSVQTDLSQAVDLRLAIIPTTHGLRAAVRLPAELVQPKSLDQLQLGERVLEDLKDFAAGDSGMLIVTGPAGSGKTTTIYALLNQIVEHSPGMSVVTLEDPVERDLAGVTQIEVSPFGQLTYEKALRSILRQDPQVLMLGEIRDAATATVAVQAALSGHRLICTFHAATTAGAIARLIEMGVERYQVTSAVHGIVCQRLVRKLGGDGYCGRCPVAEFAKLDDAVKQAILDPNLQHNVMELFSRREGFVSMQQAAREMVARGITDAAEVQRVLGTA